MHSKLRGRQYAFFISWNIDNFIVCPKKPGEYLFSPSFTIGNLGATRWRLILYPRGSKDSNYVSCYLQRLNDSSMLKEIFVNFRFGLLNFDYCNGSSLKACDNIPFTKNQYWGFSKYKRREFIEKFMQPPFLHKLTLRCDISPSDLKVPVFNEKLDMQVLSADLTSLYENEHFHDIVIQCKHWEFKVHQAVIQARAPKLAAELQLDPMSTVVLKRELDNVSVDALDYLLSYLYSGRLDLPVSDLINELFIIANRYDLFEFKKRLKSYPRHYICRTYMNVEYKSISWPIPQTSYSNTVKTLSKIIPLEREYTENLIMRCYFKSNKLGIERFDVSLCFDNFDVNKPIAVYCEIGVGDDKETLLDFFGGSKLFDSNEEWRIPFFIQNRKFNGKRPYLISQIIEISCDLTICYGERASFIESSSITSELPYSYLVDYTPLSWDLSRLRTNMAFSDVSLVVENINFPAHRVILAARSPVFKQMFSCNMIEKQTGIVRITDVSVQTVQALLTYAYSGILDSSGTDILSLYVAADKYEILHLKESCALLLISVTNVDNSCSILITAYYHCDERLIQHMKRFIRCHSADVMRTSDWTILSRTLENLAKDILPEAFDLNVKL